MKRSHALILVWLGSAFFFGSSSEASAVFRRFYGYPMFERGRQDYYQSLLKRREQAMRQAMKQATNSFAQNTNSFPNSAGTNIGPAFEPKPRRHAPLPPLPEKTAAEKAAIDQRLLDFQMKKAKEGSSSAQYELGVRYLTGKGVPRNDELARQWLLEAAQQGDNEAYEKLKDTDYSEEQRDNQGRILQSTTARKDFMARTGYPKGRPGYVIVHIVPTAKGGADTPENMQWATIADARRKELWSAPLDPARSPAPAP